MTFDIGLVLGILIVSFVLFVTEWIRMDVTALLVLGVLAVSGLLEPNEALSGFSNPAVVTVWAMFMLSAGLTQTGVANAIGRQVLKLAGKGEIRIVAIIMITSGVLSAFMSQYRCCRTHAAGSDGCGAAYRAPAVAFVDAVGVRNVVRWVDHVDRYATQPARQRGAPRESGETTVRTVRFRADGWNS